jgi:hypothetical protein
MYEKVSLFLPFCSVSLSSVTTAMRCLRATLFRGFGRLRSIRAVQQEVGEDEQASSYDFLFFLCKNSVASL